MLLARDARHVIAVDVGHGQAHPRITADTRVTVLERLDIRHLTAEMLREPPSLLVADVSFISLTLVLPAALRLAATRADLITLVKPQFEGAANKGGIVRDEKERNAALARVTTCITSFGWRVRDAVTSPITGGDGNVEFLLHACRPPC